MSYYDDLLDRWRRENLARQEALAAQERRRAAISIVVALVLWCSLVVVGLWLAGRGE